MSGGDVKWLVGGEVVTEAVVVKTNVKSGVSRRFGREAIVRVDASGGGRSKDVERTVAANCFNECEGWEQVFFGRKFIAKQYKWYLIVESIQTKPGIVTMDVRFT